MGKLIGRILIITVVAAVGLFVVVGLFFTQEEPERANAAPRPVAVDTGSSDCERTPCRI